jgi:hypothetical protein
MNVLIDYMANRPVELVDSQKLQELILNLKYVDFELL